MISTIAPAKINLTLEVLRRRDDGYHEIRSVMQTIDLVDNLTLASDPSNSLSLDAEGAHLVSDDDLVLRAVRAIADKTGVPASGSFRLSKHIPAAAGLGGGSSDAAAAIRLLNHERRLEFSSHDLTTIAASVSSDAAFFCSGGTALAQGRGDVIEPLPEVAPFWVVVTTPPASIPAKTQRMYESLAPADFSDGSTTSALAAQIRSGAAIQDSDLCNAFDRAAYATFEGLTDLRDHLIKAGAGAVHVAGSGPALFTITDAQATARNIAAGMDAAACRVDVVRSLSAREATETDGPEN